MLGIWELARRIVVTRTCERAGRKIWTHPYTVLRGFTGIDGALLQPVSPGVAESWAGIEATRHALVDDLMRNRLAAQLPRQAIAPVSHSADSYGKHYRKLRNFYAKKFLGHVAHAMADTPKGDARMVHTPGFAESPTEPAGDPMHDLLALRRLVLPMANDARHILRDHQDITARLSAELLPPEARAQFPLPSEPSPTVEPLL